MIGGVIVVDDNSPDGTAKEVEKIKSEVYDNTFEVNLIQREHKAGIGPAYITGFKLALELKPDYIMEMDADFSHNPIYIPAFIKTLQISDLVIGSRYIENGDVENWGLVRKMISKGGSIYSKLILGWKIKDATAGFVCYRREVLEKINLDKIESNGYSFQVEMKYRAYQLGFILTEIPIIFANRVKGMSKMNGKIVFEAIARVILIKFKKI